MRNRLGYWLGLRNGDGVYTRADGELVRKWKSIAHDLRHCSIGKPCADCERDAKWDCDWRLMGEAADLIEKMAKELGLASEEDTDTI